MERGAADCFHAVRNDDFRYAVSVGERIISVVYMTVRLVPVAGWTFAVSVDDTLIVRVKVVAFA